MELKRGFANTKIKIFYFARFCFLFKKKRIK
jgi:hypothetical protein